MTIIELRTEHMAKRRKPSAPRKIGEDARAPAKGDPSTWGANEAALEMPANADVATREGRGVEGKRRVRDDVFSLLYFRPGSRMSTQAYDAARRLQADMAILHRTQGACDAIRTAGQHQTGALAVVTEDFGLARVLAGERIDDVLVRMKPWSANLMRALCEHEAINGQTPDWKAMVRRHTKQHRPSQAGEMVRLAADALAESYRHIDNEPRKAA